MADDYGIWNRSRRLLMSILPAFINSPSLRFHQTDVMLCKPTMVVMRSRSVLLSLGMVSSPAHIYHFSLFWKSHTLICQSYRAVVVLNSVVSKKLPVFSDDSAEPVADRLKLEACMYLMSQLPSYSFPLKRKLPSATFTRHPSQHWCPFTQPTVNRLY